MKKILLSCATCLLAVGLLAGCDNEEEVPSEPEVPGTVVDDGGETTYLFGFEVDGTMQYIDGGLVEYNGALQSYEGSVTTSLSDAVRITIEEGDVTGAYYLSFENEGVTNWITIISGDYTNLSYSTEKAPIYYNAEYGCWGNETLDYFLCYNSAYKCLYCSALSSYGPDSTSPSPVAALYNAADGKLVTGLNGYEAPAPKEMSITGASVVYVGKTIQLGVEVDDGANPSVTWAITDSDGKETEAATISETGLVTAGDTAATGLVVTATSTLDTSVSATHELAIIDFVEPDTDSDDTYVLGCFVETDWDYRYFDGGVSSSKLTTTAEWDSAAEVYITAQTDDEVKNSCTLAIVVEDEVTGGGATKLQYITNGDGTNVTLKDDPCLWVYNEEIGAFTEDDLDGRFLVYYTDGQDIRAYAQTTTNLANPHITAYESGTAPIVPTRPDPTDITISGEKEVCVGFTIQLEATVEPVGAVQTVTWSSSNDECATVDTNGVVTGIQVTEANQPVTITATSTALNMVTQTYEITVGTTLNYSYTFKSGDLGTNSSGTQGNRSTEAGTSNSLGGLVWSYSAALYKGWDGSNNRGIQIGAGNATEAQKTNPFTLSTDFGESVRLSAITLELSNASDGGGKYSISLEESSSDTLDESNDSTTAIAEGTFSSTTVVAFSHDNLSAEGQILTISLLSTADKAIYIHGISFTVEFLGTSSTADNPVK